MKRTSESQTLHCLTTTFSFPLPEGDKHSPSTQKEERSPIPWEDIHSDLSGKVSTQSARGYKYFVVFVCTYTGAKHVYFFHTKTSSSTRTVAS